MPVQCVYDCSEERRDPKIFSPQPPKSGTTVTQTLSIRVYTGRYIYRSESTGPHE